MSPYLTPAGRRPVLFINIPLSLPTIMIWLLSLQLPISLLNISCRLIVVARSVPRQKISCSRQSCRLTACRHYFPATTPPARFGRLRHVLRPSPRPSRRVAVLQCFIHRPFELSCSIIFTRILPVVNIVGNFRVTLQVLRQVWAWLARLSRS